MNDRLPPHSQEAEAGSLGCCLLDNQHIPELHREWFYDVRNQAVAEGLIALNSEAARADEKTTVERLKSMGNGWDGVEAYVSELPGCAPTALNFDYWCELLNEFAARRAVIRVATDYAAKAFERAEDITELLDGFERDVLAIRQTKGADECSVKDLLRACVDDLEEAFQNKGKLRGIPSGFHDLDRITSGFRPGQLLVIAARPSMGKTSLAMNIAEHVAIDAKLPVGVFTLEMSGQELMFRLLCSRSRVDMSAATRGELTERDSQKIAFVSSQINGRPLHIVDPGRITISQLRAKGRRLVQQHGIQLLIVDYLQLVRSGEKRAENQTAEITLVSNGLKATARELNIPLLALAQLNRESEKDGRKPRLSDLRDSGAIEQDADLVGLLHRPDGAGGDSQVVNLIIAKHRNGQTGEIELIFHRRWTRFDSTTGERGPG